MIEEVALADPGPDEVLVTLTHGGVNPVDRYNALGRVAPEGPLPRTLGSEAVGILDGEAVLVRGHGLGSRRDGLWASAAVVPRAAVVPLPAGVDPLAAASMGVAGLTAWRVVDELGSVGSEDRVLVLGASGGVGTIICSLAHHRGATVWGQTASAEKVAFVAAQGAERVVTCDASGLLAAVADLHPTVVFDPLGGPFTAAALEALAPYGRLILFGTSAGAHGEIHLQHLYRSAQRVLGYSGMHEPEERARPALENALAALARGEFAIAVDAVLPLARVNDAFARLVERDVRGQIVLDLVPSEVDSTV